MPNCLIHKKDLLTAQEADHALIESDYILKGSKMAAFMSNNWDTWRTSGPLKHFHHLHLTYRPDNNHIRIIGLTEYLRHTDTIISILLDLVAPPTT